jgi:hypothetical protein
MHVVHVRAVFLVRSQQPCCRSDDLAEENRPGREVGRRDRTDCGALHDLPYARACILPARGADYDVDTGGSQGAHVVFDRAGD